MSDYLGTPPRELPLVRGLRERGLLDIVERHAGENRVTVSDVVGERRMPAIVRARHAAWREIRVVTGMSYPEIGRIFGRDHSTVMGACKGVAKAMPQNLRETLAAMRVI